MQHVEQVAPLCAHAQLQSKAMALSFLPPLQPSAVVSQSLGALEHDVTLHASAAAPRILHLPGVSTTGSTGTNGKVTWSSFVPHVAVSNTSLYEGDRHGLLTEAGIRVCLRCREHP